jgi:hypothetical protein
MEVFHRISSLEVHCQTFMLVLYTLLILWNKGIKFKISYNRSLAFYVLKFKYCSHDHCLNFSKLICKKFTNVCPVLQTVVALFEACPDFTGSP